MSSSIITSVITGGTNSHQTVAEELNAYATDFVTQGIVGTFTSGSPSTGAFAITQDTSPDMGVTAVAGVAYVSGTPSGQDPQVVRARMTSNYTEYTINSNSSGSTKYDWIYLEFSAANAAVPDAAADNVVTLYTSRSSSNSADNGSPPTYGLLLAVVTVANGAVSITNANIADKRIGAVFNNTANSLTTGLETLSYALTYSANNGNKEFQVTTPNNLLGLLTPGMKLAVTRSVSPPTQCAAFSAASSEFATKVSPAGLTFTSAFTCEAWVYLTSYTGQAQFIIGRTDNSTGGFALRITGNGQVSCFYGASSAFTDVTSYQSIPLYTWTHVAGVISSVSSKTGSIYIDGLSVPTILANSSSTSLTQTGNLTMGSASTGLSNTYFNGYISEARIWSTAQTSSSVQNNMAISISGSASNLVSYFQCNGNFNDGTTNANNLTATNGATAVQPGNPYNAIEYGFITVNSYSNPTTTLTIKAVGGTIPNMTLNTPQYSVVDTPYGWPSSSGTLLGHKLLSLPFLTQQTTTSTSAASFGGSSSSTYWPFTVPANCSKIRIKVFTATYGSSGVSVFQTYNGSTLLTQANRGNTIVSDFSNEILVPVIPSSVIQFNLAFYTTSGTATWSAFTGLQQQGVTVEVA